MVQPFAPECAFMYFIVSSLFARVLSFSSSPFPFLLCIFCAYRFFTSNGTLHPTVVLTEYYFSYTAPSLPAVCISLHLLHLLNRTK